MQLQIILATFFLALTLALPAPAPAAAPQLFATKEGDACCVAYAVGDVTGGCGMYAGIIKNGKCSQE
ncbi:hypothetical protein DE146DRAFT_757263 [Phaeosphaeria sp. MPI-PUGE-AT-0046c]|nr:hypothetical protein DE146DRAFT_757263 [Phaeosphaeria sp. MPI-PUGE-AT-0046c]